VYDFLIQTTSRFSLRLQLIALAFFAILLTVAFAQWQNHRIAYAEILQQTKSDIRPTPFEEARQIRRKSLAHIARIVSIDAELIPSLRSSWDTFQQYAQRLNKLPAKPSQEDLESLRELRNKELGQVMENSERLFLNTELGSIKDVERWEPYGACADVFWICNEQGVVFFEERTGDDSSAPEHVGKVLVHYPMETKKLPLPRQSQLKNEPLIQGVLEDANIGNCLHSYIKGADGYVYDAVARRLVLDRADRRKAIVILADRVDAHMMTLASELVQVENVLTLVPDLTSVARLDANLSQQRDLKERLTTRFASAKKADIEHLGNSGYFVSEYRLTSQPQNLLLDLKSNQLDEARANGSGASELGRIVFLKSEKSLNALLSQQDWSAFKVALAALSVGLLFSSVMANIVSRPLVDLAESMKKVGQGQLEVQAKVGGPSEIRHAAAAFNNMVDGLRQKETLEKFVTRLEEIRKSADVSDPLVRDQTQFGRYVVARRLGGGGMATVYVGLPVETLSEAERVAVKVIHREFAVSEDYQARFRREFNVMKSLTHPGLVQVMESGELNGLLYIIMEYVEGETLGDHLEKSGPIDVEEFYRLALPLLEAMQFSHSQGVVHRDLKPDNLMLTARGLKVMDFGLAVGSDMSRITQSGDAIGTPRYMSPEQINGVPCDGRTDQYSLGCIFYEMLTGRCPFVGADVVSLVFQHLSQDPVGMTSFRPGLPAALDAVVLRMLKKDPKQRFETLTAVKEALEASR